MILLSVEFKFEQPPHPSPAEKRKNKFSLTLEIRLCAIKHGFMCQAVMCNDKACSNINNYPVIKSHLKTLKNIFLKPWPLYNIFFVTNLLQAYSVFCINYEHLSPLQNQTSVLHYNKSSSLIPSLFLYLSVDGREKTGGNMATDVFCNKICYCGNINLLQNANSFFIKVYSHQIYTNHGLSPYYEPKYGRTQNTDESERSVPCLTVTKLSSPFMTQKNKPAPLIRLRGRKTAACFGFHSST